MNSVIVFLSPLEQFEVTSLFASSLAFFIDQIVSVIIYDMKVLYPFFWKDHINSMTNLVSCSFNPSFSGYYGDYYSGLLLDMEIYSDYKLKMVKSSIKMNIYMYSIALVSLLLVLSPFFIFFRKYWKMYYSFSFFRLKLSKIISFLELDTFNPDWWRLFKKREILKIRSIETFSNSWFFKISLVVYIFLLVKNFVRYSTKMSQPFTMLLSCFKEFFSLREVAPVKKFDKSVSLKTKILTVFANYSFFEFFLTIFIVVFIYSPQSLLKGLAFTPFIFVLYFLHFCFLKTCLFFFFFKKGQILSSVYENSLGLYTKNKLSELINVKNTLREIFSTRISSENVETNLVFESEINPFEDSFFSSKVEELGQSFMNNFVDLFDFRVYIVSKFKESFILSHNSFFSQKGDFSSVYNLDGFVKSLSMSPHVDKFFLDSLSPYMFWPVVQELEAFQLQEYGIFLNFEDEDKNGYTVKMFATNDYFVSSNEVFFWLFNKDVETAVKSIHQNFLISPEVCEYYRLLNIGQIKPNFYEMLFYNNLVDCMFLLNVERFMDIGSGYMDFSSSFYLNKIDFVFFVMLISIYFFFRQVNSALIIVKMQKTFGFYEYFSFKNIKLIPTFGQWLSETLFVFIKDILAQQTNKKGEESFNFILTTFIIFLFANLFSMLPNSFTLTSHVSFTLFISFITMFSITLLGFLIHGLSFAKIFVPSNVPFVLKVFIILIEIFSYTIRTFSLSIRMSANMLSGHTLLHIILSFIVNTFNYKSWTLGSLAMIIIFLIMSLEFGIAFLQAYVFVTLVSIYINDIAKDPSDH